MTDPGIYTKAITVGGRTLLFESGKIARQANGAVWVIQDETVVFATACAAAEPKEDINFLPLRIDHQEKFSAAGKTLSGYIKREGRPNERETLICRLIDRPLRPLFADGYYNDTQVLSYVWSYDRTHPPDVMAICAASAALTISDIPLKAPVGAVRVGWTEEKGFIINPTVAELEHSSLDLILAGTKDAILMTEGYCDFFTEEQLLEAVETGHQAIRTICEGLEEWRQEIGKPKMEGIYRTIAQELSDEVAQIATEQLTATLMIADKKKRDAAVGEIRQKVNETLEEGGKEYCAADVGRAFKKLNAKLMRRMVVEKGVRCDGRATNEIRQISVEQNILPRTHGSALFTRGETQALAVCTLGGENMAQRYEDLDGDGVRRFYLQYFFPPFSVGEVGRMGPPGRREVGHGKLAERAVSFSVPDRDNFPYVIRVESNITESNGSSSMASVCGASLAMMDAGVPVKRPVAGIAMGLILEEDKYTILSDILGVEDALGDMDFKITGDTQGITAFQMDIKVEGITPAIMRDALQQAKEGRVHILGKMLEVIPHHREEISIHAPRIETVQIHPSKIGTVIGPGGKQIRAIVEETGADIDIDDSGLISIAAGSVDAMEKAKAIIHNLTADVEVDATYEGEVKGVAPFGVFVEILPGKEGLCHISELSKERIENIEGFIKVGDRLTVKVLDINEHGKIKLSRKALLVG